MMNILKQVAYMRDNTYHLQRHIWNDVQEDWPFYTEQEKTMLRRRKPQNLTPPGSSDGSSGMHITIHRLHIREHTNFIFFCFILNLNYIYIYISYISLQAVVNRPIPSMRVHRRRSQRPRTIRDRDTTRVTME